MPCRACPDDSCTYKGVYVAVREEKQQRRSWGAQKSGEENEGEERRAGRLIKLHAGLPCLHTLIPTRQQPDHAPTIKWM